MSKDEELQLARERVVGRQCVNSQYRRKGESDQEYAERLRSRKSSAERSLLKALDGSRQSEKLNKQLEGYDHALQFLEDLSDKQERRKLAVDQLRLGRPSGRVAPNWPDIASTPELSVEQVRDIIFDLKLQGERRKLPDPLELVRHIKQGIADGNLTPDLRGVFDWCELQGFRLAEPPIVIPPRQELETPPSKPAIDPEKDVKRKRRERQMAALLQVIQDLQLDPHSLQVPGDKTRVRGKCTEYCSQGLIETGLFTNNINTFSGIWKEAQKRGVITVLNKDKYR